MTSYHEPWSGFLLNLLTAARNALEDIERPVSRAQLSHGEVAWDDCCAGQLYIRTMRIYPAKPNLTFDSQQACPAMLAGEFAIGVTRCASTMDNSGRAPNPDVLTNETIMGLEDAMALLGVLSCEMKNLTGYGKHLKHIIGEWTALGPDGGCQAGEWLFTLGSLGCGC